MKNYDLQPIIDTLDSSITRLKELMKPSESITEHEKYTYLFELLINEAYDSSDNKLSFYQILNKKIQKLKEFKQPDNLPEPKDYEKTDSEKSSCYSCEHTVYRKDHHVCLMTTEILLNLDGICDKYSPEDLPF